MDQNSPEDIFTLGEYLGREQYGTRPLFYGPAYSSKVALDVEDGYCVPRQKSTDTKYVRKEKTSPDEKDSYVELPGRVNMNTRKTCSSPASYSSAHTAYYKSWQDITGYDVPYDQCGEMLMVNMPTSGTTSSSSSPTSSTSCTGATSCGTLPDGRTTSKAAAK